MNVWQAIDVSYIRPSRTIETIFALVGAFSPTTVARYQNVNILILIY